MTSNLCTASSVPSLAPLLASSRKPRVQRLILAKALTPQAVEDKLHFLRTIKHKNLVSAKKILFHESSDLIEVILQHLPVSVTEICVRAFSYHDEISLAAILGQVRTIIIAP